MIVPWWMVSGRWVCQQIQEAIGLRVRIRMVCQLKMTQKTQGKRLNLGRKRWFLEVPGDSLEIDMARDINLGIVCVEMRVEALGVYTLRIYYLLSAWYWESFVGHCRHDKELNRQALGRNPQGQQYIRAKWKKNDIHKGSKAKISRDVRGPRMEYW